MLTDSVKREGGKPAVMDRYAGFCSFERVCNRLETALNMIGVYLIMILMFFTAGEIIGRFFFNNPIPGYVETSELMMAGIVFLGISYTQRVGAHIRMDVISKKLVGRLYHTTEALCLLLGLVVSGIICHASLNFALDAYRLGDVTEYLYLPTWPSKLCVPLGSFLLCLRLLIQIIRNTAQAIIGVEIKTLE